jgi:CubicO group peptidase (beta-lactamase class C family)
MKQKAVILSILTSMAGIWLTTACAPDTLDSEYQSVYPLAEEEGLNGKALEWLVKDIQDGNYGEVRSLVIMRNGRVVLEEYFENNKRDSLLSLFSITKSVLSALYGIAMEQGYIQSLDETIWSYFESYGPVQNMDGVKAGITIGHLLSMSAGLDWNELGVPFSDPSNTFVEWEQADDEIQFVLDRPLVTYPGTVVNYNSGLSQLLSVIFTESTGQAASEFAAENLFNHLGIEDWSWSALNDSVSNGGWGLRLRPLDLAKFGQLYLQQGRWGDTQVVPEDWVAASTDSLGVMNIWVNYGYQWWRYGNRMVAAGMLDSTGIYMGTGWGGQYLWIIPYYNMVVAVLAANSDDSLLDEPMLWDYLLRMIEE